MTSPTSHPVAATTVSNAEVAARRNIGSKKWGLEVGCECRRHVMTSPAPRPNPHHRKNRGTLQLYLTAKMRIAMITIDAEMKATLRPAPILSNNK